MLYSRPALLISVMTFNSIRGLPKVTPLLENVQAGQQDYSTSSAYEADE